MALRLSRWIALAGLGCAGLLAYNLPPERPEQQFATIEDDATPERRHARALADELLAARLTLQRLHWADSLGALTWGAAERPVPLVAGAPLRAPGMADGVEPADLEEVANAVAMELARRGAPRPAVDLGVFLLRQPPGAEPLTTRTEWYAGVRDGRPYCISARVNETARIAHQTLLAYSWRGIGDERRTQILGPCALYARYGLPGPAIQRWMQGPGGARAIEWEFPDWTVRTTGMDQLGRRASVEVGDLELEGCVRGRASACAALFSDHRPNAKDPVARHEPAMLEAGIPIIDGIAPIWDSESATALAARRMLHDLERQFGGERFARFWTSDRPVPEAFEAAFGMTAERWTQGWAARVWGDTHTAAVMPAPAHLTLTLAIVALVLLRAVLVARNRRVA